MSSGVQTGTIKTEIPAQLFGFGNLLSLYFHTPSGNVPYYLAVFAAGNFAGALLLSLCSTPSDASR